MVDGRDVRGGSGIGQRLLIESVLEDGLDALVGGGLDGQGALAGGFEPVYAVDVAQALEAHAGAKAQFGMGAGGNDALGDLGSGLSGFAHPTDDALGRPFRAGAMAFGHMFVSRGVVVFFMGAHVAGDTDAMVEDFDGRDRQADLDLLFHEAIGDAVVVVVRADMVVEIDAGLVPLGILIARGGQGIEGGLVQVFKQGGLLRTMTRGDLTRLTPKMIGDAAKRRDRLALTILNETAAYLGLWLGGIASLLDPEVIVIGGGVSQIGKPLFDKIREAVPDFAMNRQFLPKLPIIPARLKDNVGVYGAASLFLPTPRCPG